MDSGHNAVPIVSRLTHLYTRRAPGRVVVLCLCVMSKNVIDEEYRFFNLLNKVLLLSLACVKDNVSVACHSWTLSSVKLPLEINNYSST